MLTPIQAVQLRKTLGKVLIAVATNQERFVIQRAGIPTAVLLPLQEYQHLCARAEEGRQEANLRATWQMEEGTAESTTRVREESPPAVASTIFRAGSADTPSNTETAG